MNTKTRKTHTRAGSGWGVRTGAVLGCALLLQGALAGTVEAGAGQRGLAFLKVGAGTDAIGMGNAYVSQVRDATSTYWNPAGLARGSGTDLFLMHNESIADLRMEYVALSRAFGRHGLGFSFNGLFTGTLEGRDENGEITGEVGYHDLAVTLGYGYQVTDEITAGVNGRYLREFIGDPGATNDHVANGLALDLGVQVHKGATAFGLAVQNLGSEMAFNQVQLVSQSGPGTIVGGENFEPPTAIQGGVTFSPSWDVLEGGVEFALEGRQVLDEDFNLLFGTRYLYRNLAALSVGYRTGLDTENVSFGLRVNRNRLRVGYAFVPFSDDLGTSHRLSLGYHVQ